MAFLLLSDFPARFRKAPFGKQRRARAVPVGRVLQFQVGSSHFLDLVLPAT